jgi:hypothetical protein
MSELQPDPRLFTIEDLKLLKSFADKIQIGAIRILKHAYFRDNILDEEPTMQMKVGFQLNNTGFVDSNNKTLATQVTLVVYGEPLDEKFKDKVPFRVETTVEIHYDASSAAELTPEDAHRGLTALCHSSSPVHVWPFLRQQVHEAMSKMLMPPIELPILYPEKHFALVFDETLSTPPPDFKKP